MLESLTFLSPWVLSALAAVPVLWWLLRALPPRPRAVRFSAFFLLKDLQTKLTSAAHMPWWLLLLRALMVVLFIGAFAGPVLHPSQDFPGGTQGNVLIIVDNGWASAAGWGARQEKLKEYIKQIRRSGRPVIFMPTAPSDEDGQMHFYGPMPGEEAEGWAGRLKPQPWRTAHGDAGQLAQKLFDSYKVTHSVFLSDGLEAETRDLLVIAQARGGGLTLVTDDTVNDPYILRQALQKPGALDFTLERLKATSQNMPLQILAYAGDDSVVDELKINFPAGSGEYAFSWDMPAEVRDKVARIALRERAMASAVFLASAQWRQHPAGVVANATQKESRDFLSEVYYLRRALAVNDRLTIDRLDALLKMPLSALILPDSTPLTAVEKGELHDWVQRGGFLIRFAGPNLAANAEGDLLLPVPLRYGQRAMEGAMTWETPVRLGDISEQSPLYGLPVPQDVTVAQQVLADPLPEVFEKTWLHLEDGTPLITGSKMGKGTIVLVHTSAGPDWSNFCYSGLYVEALQRMVSISSGISDYKVQTTLPPLLLLDGFGRLHAPDSKSIATSAQPGQEFMPSPQTPPGIYGDPQTFRSFNLGQYLPKMAALQDIPRDVTVLPYQAAAEIDLKPFLLKAALLLLLADTLLTLWLRGVAVFGAACLLMFACVSPAAAEDEKNFVSGMYLAYVETGDQDIDRTSYNGLTGLGEVVSTRTTAKIKGVVGVDPAADMLSYYPVIYWPMTAGQEALSTTAARNIQDYLDQGGMILFDTRDRQFGGDGSVSMPGSRKLRELMQNIQIPELTGIPAGHILSRSFYLLDKFPGRYDGGKLWVEKAPNPHHDGVTSVIIGSHDWAAAWSKDQGDRTRFMIEPGGEMQREMAWRFGVNMVMVALTGNYKADQVHISHILQRLGQ